MPFCDIKINGFMKIYLIHKLMYFKLKFVNNQQEQLNIIVHLQK